MSVSPDNEERKEYTFNASPNFSNSASSNTFGVTTQGKSMILAYVLWWFLGLAGVHRMYLGRIGSGITMLCLFFFGWLFTFAFGIGLLILIPVALWWLIDVYLTHEMVNEENAKLGVTQSTITFNTAAQNQAPAGKDKLDELEKLWELKEKGVITEEEYQTKRKELI